MKKKLITTSLIAAVFAMPAFADPTAQELLDQKTVTSKYYVDQELATKQDTITIDKVLFQQGNGGKIPDIYVPAIVATNAAGTTLNGNTVGVLDLGSMGESVSYGMNMYTDASDYNIATMDNFVPTVRAVANALATIRGSLVGNMLFFSTDETTATNNYSTSFSGTTGNWPQNDYDKIVTGSALADGLALKQNKIAAGNAGEVVTYTGTAGQVGSVGVYNGSTTYNAQTDASKLATAGVVEVVNENKQDKMTCAGYVPGHENDINYCWLYGDVQVAAAAPQCEAYGEDVKDVSECCSGVLQSGTNLCGCNDVSDCTNKCSRPQTRTCSVDKVCTCA